MKLSEPIVFFGSGPVAARSLELLAGNFEIEAVITKPQPAHHKEPFPVLVTAASLGIKTLTPNGKAELSTLFGSRPVSARVGVVIDYGFIINQDVIDYFPLGIINSHFSLLPEWRGADPITFAILSGQQQTGVSLMLIVAKMDEGPLLAQAPYDITESITTPELTNDLIEVSDQMLRQILPLYLDGKIQPADQASVTMAASPTPSYSRKLTKADGVIDWHKPAAQLEREVRAFIDWPKSRTRLGAHEVIISKAHVVPEVAADTKPGAVTSTAGKDGILVTTGDQTLCIDELKPIGKAAMSARAFLAGYHI